MQDWYTYAAMMEHAEHSYDGYTSVFQSMFDWKYYAGYDVKMVSEIAEESGFPHQIAFPEGYVLIFYFNLEQWGPVEARIARELVKVPGFWEWS